MPELAPADVYPEPASSGTRVPFALRSIGLALLSAAIPGLGQPFLAQFRVGGVLLAFFVAFMVAFWFFRLGTYFGVFVVSIFALPVLHFASAWHMVRLQHAALGGKIRASLLIVCALLGFLMANWAIRLTNFAAGLRLYTTASSSMQPTIFRDEVVMVDLHYYRGRPVSRGDVVIHQTAMGHYVKRVIAIPGDELRIDGMDVYLNGQLLKEPYAQYEFLGASSPGAIAGPLKLPEGEYFVMGDDRDVSLDSRYPAHGNVRSEDVVGKPLYVVISSQNSRFGSLIQ